MENISNVNNLSQSRESYLDSLDDLEVNFDNEGSINNQQVQEQNIVESDNLQSDIQQEEMEPEIDERFQNLPRHEALIRTFQSRADKYKTELDKISKEVQEKNKYVEVLDLLLEDDEVFNAFVRERKPELIKEQDFTVQLRERLSKEFPELNEGVRYSRQEADEEPGGKAWLYFKRLDEIYNELKGNSGAKFQTLKEAIIAKRKQKQQLEAERQALIQKGVDEIRQTLKWNDDQIKNFYDNITKASLLTLAKMYTVYTQVAQNNNQTKVPTKSGTPITPSARQRFLDGL